MKAHVAAEPDTGIVTALKLTPANHPDGPVGVALMEDEPDGLEVLADSAYGSGAVRTAFKEKNHRLVIKPLPSRPHILGGFVRDDFSVDHDARWLPALSDISPGSLQVASRASPRTVFPVRCGLVARRPKRGASPFLSTTPSSSQRERTGATPSSALPIDNTARWPSARSPGSSRRGTDGFAIAVSSATKRGSTDASRRSTCAGSSCSVSRGARAPGCSPAPNGSSGASQGGNDTCGRKTYQPRPVHTLYPGSSVRAYPRGPKTNATPVLGGGKGLVQQPLVETHRAAGALSTPMECYGVTKGQSTAPLRGEGWGARNSNGIMSTWRENFDFEPTSIEAPLRSTTATGGLTQRNFWPTCAGDCRYPGAEGSWTLLVAPVRSPSPWLSTSPRYGRWTRRRGLSPTAEPKPRLEGITNITWVTGSPRRQPLTDPSS